MLKYKTLSKISKFCHKNLLNNDEVLSYLLERKISQESIERFQIGLFPKDVKDLFSFGDPKYLRSLGIIKNVSKSVFNTWKLIFPIQDAYGNHIALAGRVIFTGEELAKRKIPKYMNTIYNKSHHLFGLNFAKEEIVKQNKVYVVEGYFDVISPHQHGLKNMVAICGSFLSTRHLVLLSRYTDNIILMFDNEPTAQGKALRVIDKKSRDGFVIRAKNILPNDIKDVDEFLKKYSINDLNNLLNSKTVSNQFSITPIW